MIVPIKTQAAWTVAAACLLAGSLAAWAEGPPRKLAAVAPSESLRIMVKLVHASGRERDRRRVIAHRRRPGHLRGSDDPGVARGLPALLERRRMRHRARPPARRERDLPGGRDRRSQVPLGVVSRGPGFHSRNIRCENS
jgi:hypothetical protein